MFSTHVWEVICGIELCLQGLNSSDKQTNKNNLNSILINFTFFLFFPSLPFQAVLLCNMFTSNELQYFFGE